MLNAIDVANFFIDLANNTDEDFMTNMRLNKMLYYAQAWNLVRTGDPLFEEDIQAWKYGPVIPSVYQKFKVCGKDRIEDTYDGYSSDVFSTEELEFLIDIAREYGKYSSPQLVTMTHIKNGPWNSVYSPCENNLISQESMKEYFSTYESLPSFDLPEQSEDDFVGYRNEDGILVLPKEYDDEAC